MDLLKGVVGATFQISDLVVYGKLPKDTKDKAPTVIYWAKGDQKALKSYLKKFVAPWQIETVVEGKTVQEFQTEEGAVWVVRPDLKSVGKPYSSAAGRARDAFGAFWRAHGSDLTEVHVHFCGAKEADVEGVILGMGLASYKFLNVYKAQDRKLKKVFVSADKGSVSKAAVSYGSQLAAGMNLARHLANMPPVEANPESISLALKSFFSGGTRSGSAVKGVKAELWDADALKKEGFGLLYNVGRGSEHGARLLKLSYRGAAKKSAKPYAFIGKGVTFDTGGLDIKPSAGMRLMKKDMSGAAAMAGLCFFVSQSKLKVNVDFYLPLAENAVSDRATKPGDVHKAYNGLLVEIDNTDAEGRLVMGDVMAYVSSAKKGSSVEAAAIFDVATLTGAMRVALGLDIGGYFSTDEKLAARVEKAASEAGEWVWRMPLIEKYAKGLSSAYADCKNSADSGFGGAITAALFLQKFVGQIPWVHFDVMSWNMAPDGALSDGGNAQTVQTLAQFLRNTKS